MKTDTAKTLTTAHGKASGFVASLLLGASLVLNGCATTDSRTVGTVVPEGHPHAGFIDGGTLPGEQKPTYYKYEPEIRLSYKDIFAWAENNGCHVPALEEGKKLDARIKGNGSFAKHFESAIDNPSTPAGFVWLAEPDGIHAWCQRLSDGGQLSVLSRYGELPALCVRR